MPAGMSVPRSAYFSAITVVFVFSRASDFDVRISFFVQGRSFATPGSPADLFEQTLQLEKSYTNK
jgi:hypothetical protein